MERLLLATGLFPAGVVARGLRLVGDAEANLQRLQAAGAGALPASSLSRAVRQRRLDHAAGRWCAREALRDCAPAVAEASIPIGPHREPVWPPGIAGSIAHTHGYAVAAVARTEVARGIGIDVERWLDDDAPRRLAADLSVEDELDALARVSGWRPAHVLTLVFSAKETLFKCLFPQVREYFGFQDARIVHMAGERFIAELARPLGPWPALSRFEGRFQRMEDGVVTALALEG